MSDNMNDINDNIGAVLYIMLGRIYDMLVVIADAVGKGEDALHLIELHRHFIKRLLVADAVDIIKIQKYCILHIEILKKNIVTNMAKL